MFTKPKLLIFLISIILIPLLGIIIFFFYKNTIQTKLQPTPTPPAFTGLRNENLPDEILVPAQEAQNLRIISPVYNADFIVKYDYKNFKFEVQLKDASKLSIFQQWLKDNHYDKIPTEKFVYNSQ